MSGRPACYWCVEAIESRDLKMGEVSTRRRGRSRTSATFDLFDSQEEEWEEEWIEKRPFHKKCWDEYRGRR